SRNRRGVLDEDVVEKGHTAFDRRRHAHLVLLHQQLDEVRLQVRMAHALEPPPRTLGVAAEAFCIGVPARGSPGSRRNSCWRGSGKTAKFSKKRLRGLGSSARKLRRTYRRPPTRSATPRRTAPGARRQYARPTRAFHTVAR